MGRQLRLLHRFQGLIGTDVGRPSSIILFRMLQAT
ncbi:MAG: hypothetical protein ACI8Y8_004354, partial [Planctomycetota bacterium]